MLLACWRRDSKIVVGGNSHNWSMTEYTCEMAHVKVESRRRSCVCMQSAAVAIVRVNSLPTGMLDFFYQNIVSYYSGASYYQPATERQWQRNKVESVCLKGGAGADSIGHGDTVGRKTANQYWPLRKRSLKRPILLVKPKNWRGTTIYVRITFIHQNSVAYVKISVLRFRKFAVSVHPLK